ncbi:MAG: NAD-binding protein [Candidatus Eremiobacteraeota bacterium]|nr:NAD-binding protein [Candidatus Eremiobacteraeota bacterium]MBV9647260.1 NAD-binding protein [Candidatus Eremiobacteraeota bacterium]
MFILIVGGGKVGTYLARALLAQDHEVVVIEKQARKAQYMSNILDTDVALVGDGCDPEVLRQAGIVRADVVVADTGDDEDNLVVCLIAKKHSKARCIARVNNPKNKMIFESVDTERPITLVSSTEIILDLINEYVNAQDYSIITRLRDGDLELLKLTVGPESPSNGKRIGDIGLPRGSIVVAVDRPGDELVIPSGDTVLHAGDQVIVMGKRDYRIDVRRAIMGLKVPA